MAGRGRSLGSEGRPGPAPGSLAKGRSPGTPPPAGERWAVTLDADVGVRTDRSCQAGVDGVLLRAVSRTSEAVRRGAGRERLLALVSRETRVLLAADLCYVVTGGAQDQPVVVVAACGRGTARRVGRPISSPSFSRAVTRAIMTGRPVVGTSGDRRRGAAPRQTGPVVVLPLVGACGVLGALVAVNRVGRAPAFAPQALGLAEAFAAHAALALTCLHVREVARSLSDGACQLLFGVRMTLAAASAGAQPPVAHHLETAGDDIQRLLGRLRTEIPAHLGEEPRAVDGRAR